MSPFSTQAALFRSLPKKNITRENIREFMLDDATKRINFASTHADALRRTEQKDGGKIVLPFPDTVKYIMEFELDKPLFSSSFGGIWRGILTDKEYTSFADFIIKYNDIVFLRDNLDLSVAISMNYVGDKHTEIGELEYQAKFNHNTQAEEKLIEKCNDRMQELPFYKYADCICAMPDSKPNESNLPRRIVNSLSGFEFIDVSDNVSWTSKTKKVKDAASCEEKLEILDNSGFAIAEGTDIKDKTIILFDDLYMSGISMQYVAMKLKEAGASRVFGLTIVKSRSNTAR